MCFERNFKIYRRHDRRNFRPIFSTRFLCLWRRFWAFMDRTERHTNYPNLFRSTSLIHYLLVIFHWNGCLYHIIYKNNGFGSKNWVFSDSETADVVKQYLQSYYWCTLALTTIGDLPRYLLFFFYQRVLHIQMNIRMDSVREKARERISNEYINVTGNFSSLKVSRNSFIRICKLLSI